MKIPAKALEVAAAAIEYGWKAEMDVTFTPRRTTVFLNDGTANPNRSIIAEWDMVGNWYAGQLTRDDRFKVRKMRNAGEVIRIVKGEIA